MDENHSVYLLSEGGDTTIAKRTHMGGFGGGSIAVVSKDASTAIPFKLSDGDKTMAALSGAKSAQTLYAVRRGLEQKGHLDGDDHQLWAGSSVAGQHTTIPEFRCC